MKKFLANLLNVPWMIEEQWMQDFCRILVSSKEIGPEALQVYQSQNVLGTKNAQIRGNTAIVPIYGPIFARPNFITEYFGIGLSLKDFAVDFQSLVDNPDIETIILDVDSPGGTVTGVNETAQLVRKASKEKSIISYVGGTGASAGYWLSAAAGEIVLDATARVGSIGVVVAVPSPREDDDYIEIVNTASPNKRVDPTKKEGKAVITAELDALADVFISTMADFRGVSNSVVKKDFGKGSMLVGQGAVDAGMADRISSLEDLLLETNGYEKPNEKTKIESKGENSMNVKELKEKYPDLAKKMEADAAAAATAAATATHDAIIAEKEGEISDLKDKLSVSDTNATALDERVKGLEKTEAIRQEKDNLRFANDMMDARLAASTIPARLHPKVKTVVDHNKFINDKGIFDAEAFTKDFDAEATDWEKQFEDIGPIQGAGQTNLRDPDASDAETDEALSSLLSHIIPEEVK